ncbi:hypothetical protein IV203_033549 [Nitzschia inconspicua]|uniref:Uncharacterized protein n=1 Tax=Nitzschia inconspicua TaxID=303405 RepID=A0A9K3M3U0_9STRA|nr:hypothetical protein IV203_023738 [Nitzschia inconspicua]KAG7372825.1 hypothetical protein IV203_033549 [Nitzschia inconspicua]
MQTSRFQQVSSHTNHKQVLSTMTCYKNANNVSSGHFPNSLLNVPSNMRLHPNLLVPASSDKIQNTIDMIDAALRVVEWDVHITPPVSKKPVSQFSGPEQ